MLSGVVPFVMVPSAADFEAVVAKALEPILPIRVAYLFGSRARGTARPDSDVDIAVMLPRDLSDREREEVRRDVVDALTDALGRVGEHVDVVELDRCDSALAFAAIRHGKRLFARTEEERVAAEVSICKRHSDDAPKRALFRAAAIRVGRELGEAGRGRV